MPWPLGYGLFQGDKLDAASRGAYQRMLAKARPDGMVGALPALPAHAPSGARQ